MGRNSGFIAANTSLACPDVNFVLIPEVPFTLEGEKGVLRSLERGFEVKKDLGRHPHSVIVVAEGAGQDLMGNTGKDLDASGNVRFRDIGYFLKEKNTGLFQRSTSSQHQINRAKLYDSFPTGKSARCNFLLLPCRSRRTCMYGWENRHDGGLLEWAFYACST